MFLNEKMESLDLSDNQISDLAPDCLRALKNLEFLNLSKNRLTEFETFPRSRKLIEVDLSYNKIEK